MEKDDSFESKVRKNHIANLIALAYSDGDFHKNEMEFLAIAAKRWHVTHNELREILSSPEKNKFIMPASNEEKIEQMMDLVWMMIFDGQIRDEEMDFCKKMAVKLGFNPSHVNELIDEIVTGIKRLINRSVLVKKISEIAIFS